MELTNDFRVGVSAEEAWKVLTDLERIAPMLPGAQLQEVEGDEYRGVVKVKVGPISAQYKGVATFLEREEAAGRVVLKATGRDTRGQGNASAIITATMTPDGDATRVSVVTDLTITGKVAQFGRGVLGEVSAKLMTQFVDALEADLASTSSAGHEAARVDEAAPAAEAVETDAADEADPVDEADLGSTSSTGDVVDAPSTNGSTAGETSGVRTIQAPEAEPVDLIAVAGGSAAKRVAPLAAVAAVVLVVLVRRRARRGARS